MRNLLWMIAAAGTLYAQPKPSDVFREYRYTNDTIIEAAPDPKQLNPKFLMRREISGRERSIDVWDLEDATRAELALELWGGHAGTSNHSIRVNGGEWLRIPQLKGTPTQPECYLRQQMGSAIVPIPIEKLKLGRNMFQFQAGPQICHAENWGIFKVYAFIVRIYYGPDKPRPDGRIVSPANGSTIGDDPVLTAEARGTEGNEKKIEFTKSSAVRVDYVARYEDFNWEGDGVFRQWHQQFEQGEIKRHIGTSRAAPWPVKWDTQWIPDQSEPIEVAARITDTHGIVYMTPAVRTTLVRPNRSVKMYKAHNVPEKFGVRVGATLSCLIDVADDPVHARAARITLSTWAGAHADAFGLNGVKIVDRIGTADYYSFDSMDFSPKLVKRGENTFYVFSNTQEHHAEVNWPGPVLLLEFAKPEVTSGSK